MTCSICGRKSKTMMGCSLGELCEICSADYWLAQEQAISSHSTAFWILAETFFRRGKGESVTFEQVWNEHKCISKLRKSEYG